MGEPYPAGLLSTVVVVFGPPGSGKGTQTQGIAELFGLPRKATGEMIRTEIRNRTQFGRRIEQTIAEGRFVDDDTIIGMLERELQREDLTRGLLLDGFPRTAPQARRLDVVTSRLRLGLRGFELQARREVLIRRLSGRRTCESCGKVYHIETRPPRRENACDDCDSRVRIRDDDSAVVVESRLARYEKETTPAIEQLRALLAKRGRTIEPVDAELAPGAVTDRIVERLKTS